MRLRSFAHKGVRQLYERGDHRGIDARIARKLQNMLAFLEAASSIEEVKAFPHWQPHPLRGNRAGVWSLTVTRNHRLTFRYDEEANELTDIDLEDYH